GPINPIVTAAEWFETVADVSGRIIQLSRPLLFLPIVNPGGDTAVFEVKDLVAEGAEAEQVLKAGPGLPAQARTTDRAGEDDLHSVVPESRWEERPARCQLGGRGLIIRLVASNCPQPFPPRSTRRRFLGRRGNCLRNQLRSRQPPPRYHPSF